MPVSAEGRVEHQKQNQTATSQWPVGFVFGVQLDYSCRLKSVPSDTEKVVHSRRATFGEFKYNICVAYQDSKYLADFKNVDVFL